MQQQISVTAVKTLAAVYIVNLQVIKLYFTLGT